jgi:peptidoglycan hydrolase CwlO-like protein
MTPFNRITLTLLTSLLILGSSLSFATTSSNIAQLRIQQKQLGSATKALEQQITSKQSQIKKLKRKIESLQIHNQELSQHLLDEMAHFDHQINTIDSNR